LSSACFCFSNSNFSLSNYAFCPNLEALSTNSLSSFAISTGFAAAEDYACISATIILVSLSL